MNRLFTVLLFCLGIATGKAQTLTLDSTVLTLTVAIDSTKLTAPWDIEWGFDNRLWITDAKDIKVWNPVTKAMKKVYSVSKGYTMGIALPKQPPSSGPTYVYAVIDTHYYYGGSSGYRLYRLEYDAVGDSLKNPSMLLECAHVAEHSGGQLALGADGKLWMTTAEYTFTNDTIGALNGRILRMNPDGSAAGGNLRPDRTYSIGHRNPQGLVVLPDGKVYSSEHSGPAPQDEVNLITLGGNYGWPAMQGYNSCAFVMDSCNSPTFQANHKRPAYSGTLTPAGLDYYNHPAIPEWQNCLIVATLWQPDTCLAVLQLNAAHDSIKGRRNYLKKHAGGINDFKRTRDVCAAPDGSIYYIVHDRSYTLVGGELVNIGCKIIQMKNNAYISNVPEVANSHQLTISPNPAGDVISFEHKDAKTVDKYYIADETGKVVLRGVCRNGKNLVDIKELPNGVYELVLEGKMRATGRFVVMH